MRDRSASYWFTKGDVVQVVEDVFSSTYAANNNNNNLKGRIGTVVETWEKCDVDPTCCCAEQVDLNMAVRVLFLFCGNDNDNNNNNNNNKTILNNSTTTTTTTTNSTQNNMTTTTTATSNNNNNNTSFYYYYFAEEELIKL